MTGDTNTRYVMTSEAQCAVKGREVEILNAIDVPWKAGQRAHIQCPYPDHGGAYDWRMNAEGRAICTCTDGKTDSIFDVVGKIEGRDFEEAKIRCVEIIGMANLIRQKSGGSGKGFQASDARALLNAPADRRDDTLPKAYLAYRLGIEANRVLMPGTRAVGLRSLGYYDPPKGNGAKPVRVGEYPCAVFETRDAAGNTHAHRIYLAPLGAGKAELGKAASGKRRDPKKSARIIGDDRTGGRSVLWGDPAVAPWCIVAEGIETAAAVAHAFRPEIERGDVLVVSAINAGGIEAFKPWPSTRRVTIAADRDEEVKEGRPISTRRGEISARVFGVRNRDRVSVAITLPGAPDSSCDWLDVYNQEGSDAVRAGIQAAVGFAVTSEEIRSEQDRVEGINELQRIERDYPLPPLDTFKLGYQRTARGKIRVHHWVKAGEEMVAQPICSPFGVLSRLRFVDQSNTYGLRVVVEGMNGKRREIDIERRTFAKHAGSETLAMLFAAGLRPEGDGQHLAVQCLKAADPTYEIAVVRSPGWHAIDGIEGQFFVCPSGRIVGVEEDDVGLELAASSCISEGVAVGGTLEGWKAAVAAAAGVAGCQHWTLGTLAGFAAPLIALSGLDTCGINLSGRTSGGKTTAQRLAVSAWSRAALDQRDSLLQTARATINGAEAMAARSNASILALDELGHVSGKDLGKTIYSLTSSVAKGRMTPNVAFRNSATWSTFILLSSEKSLEEKVRGDGGEWTGGMAARIPDVDITGVDRTVSRAVLVQIQSVDQHYGHAGPAFAAALIKSGTHKQPGELRAAILQGATVLAGEDADASLKRAALPFAIMTIAGELAQKFGILPEAMDVEGAVRWGWARFQGSTDALSLDPEEQVPSNLRTWIAERWDSSIHSIIREEGARAPSRDALAWYDDIAVYIPTVRLVEAAGVALKEAEVARALGRLGFIAKRKSDRHLFVDWVPTLGKVKAYALSRETFGRTTQNEPAFSVHLGGRA